MWFIYNLKNLTPNLLKCSMKGYYWKVQATHPARTLLLLFSLFVAEKVIWHKSQFHSRGELFQ